MKSILIYTALLLLLVGCTSPFEKQFNEIEPLELGDALLSIDTLNKCKKEWISKRIINYHSSQNYPGYRSENYHRATLNNVIRHYCDMYDSLTSKWQSVYNMNKKIKKIVQIDTAYVMKDKNNEVKIIISFKQNNEIESASFDVEYISYYNYKNSLGPDKKLIDNYNYNLNGNVFKEKTSIVYTPNYNFSQEHILKSQNDVIKGAKSDEYKIDYHTIQVNLKDGSHLSFIKETEIPIDICLTK